MKILFVNKFLYPNGGSETYIFELADKLNKMNHEVSFFGMDDERNIVSNNLGLSVSNLNFHNDNIIKKMKSSFKVVYSSEAKKKIRKVLADFKPDIVHLNNYNYQLTPSILYEIKKQKIPVVMTLHDFQIICPNHMLFIERTCEICEACKGNKYMECVKQKCIHNSRIKSILGALEASIYNQLKTYKKTISSFIAPSNFMKNKVVEFGEDINKISVLHNFIPEFEVDQKSKKQNFVLYFGRLTKQKGILTLLEAIKMNPNISFVVAGTGDLAHLFKEIGNVKYVGFLNKDELKTVISEALFSINPAECYDNCPMSVLESQMYGTPVIGANIGGIPELIDNELDGLLFEPGDANDLSLKINILNSDRKKLKDYSEKCMKKAKRFSIAFYTETLIGIYQKAIMRKEEINHG